MYSGARIAAMLNPRCHVKNWVIPTAMNANPNVMFIALMKLRQTTVIFFYLNLRLLNLGGSGFYSRDLVDN
jgi:hypothetical protein